GVALQAGTTYRLTWNSGEMRDGGDITISVSGVSDIAGNAIDAAHNSATDVGAAIGIAPQVQSVAVHSGSEVDVTFDELMDASALVAANYALSGTGQGTLAIHPDTVSVPSGSTYRLSWTNGEMFNGGDVTVTVAGAADLAGNEIDVAHNSGTDASG